MRIFEIVKENVNLREAAELYHDVFIANLGAQALGSLTVSLDEAAQKTLKLDDFWTVGGAGNEQLSAFDKTYNVTSAAKIRLRLKDEPEKLETNEISGVLTISSAAGTKYIYLTGSVMPEIVTDNVPNGVKYVPYSVMVQTNNHVDSNKVTFSVASGSLPDGISLNASTGEIYGVPTKVGTYSFSVKASFSTAGLEDSVKDYTIEILENTDNNVDAASDDPILNRVSYMGDVNDDWNGQFRDQVFRVDHEYAEFVKFFIDGDLLRDGSDYVSEEGSTKITILRKTFERYGNGTHTIAAEFRDKGSNTMTKAAQN